MINFFKKSKVCWNSALLRARTTATNSGCMCGVQRVNPVIRLWVGGQAAAGAQWESLAPAGSSQDLLDQAPRPVTGTCVYVSGGVGVALDRWHLKPWVT